jgi:hypothetical protein
MQRLLALLGGLIWSSVGLGDVPMIAMTYPPANATILETLSPTILLQANASDADDGVYSVSFIVCPATGPSCGGTSTMVGTARSAPYQFAWTPPQVLATTVVSTRYLVWATVSNTLGQTATSASVPVTLVQPAPLPTVKLVAPSAPIGFATPAAPVLYATAIAGNTTPASSIARVDFLDGQDVIGTVLAPNVVPTGYAYTWPNPTLGPHQIAARAIDTLGDSATSPSVAIYIFAADQAPEIALTSPRSGQTFNSASAIPLAAAPTSGRTIERVEFVAGNNVVATAFAPPYAASWIGPPPGNFAIVARAFDDLGVAVASPAAYVWVTDAPRPPAVVLTAPAPGSVVPASSPLPLAAIALAPDGAIGRVDFYAGSTMLGSVPTAPYTFAWPKPSLGAQSLTAKAYDLLGRSAVSTPVAVTVSGKIPLVGLTAPLAGARLTAPATVGLTAAASEVGGTIAKIDFYANGALIATQAMAPYNATWTHVAAGTYSLTAKATDSVGATQTSAAVNISVVDNVPPTVALTMPANGQGVFAGQPVMLTATASDSDGVVSKVEFLVDGFTISAVASPPFTQTWTPTSAGGHTLQARATDNVGAFTTSLPVVINVGQNAAPVAAITAPTSNQAFSVGQAITITATASDPDGTISKLEFIADGAVIGSVSGAPFSKVWSGATAGAHALSVRATDNVGAVTLSAPLAITVSATTLPVVSIVSPTTGDVVSAGNAVMLSATASSAVSTISRVDFYNAGTTLIGSVTTAPYVFAWTGVAAGTFLITAKATDKVGAFATSSSVSIRVVTPTLAIASPSANAAVGADFVLVTGTYQAGSNSGVTVNGVIASDDGQGNFAANNVPLIPGSNTLTVTLTTADGQTVGQTQLVSSGATAPMQLYADPDVDFAPATFTIRVKNRTANAIASFSYSNLGGGQFDASTSNQAVLGTVTYTTPGLYTPRFAITDSSAKVYTQTLALQVQDKASLDQTLRRLWSDFTGALAAGNIPRAIAPLSITARVRYGPVLTQIAPTLPGAVSAWGALQGGALGGEISEYWVQRQIGGTKHAYFIYFLRSPEGIWQLDSM